MSKPTLYLFIGYPGAGKTAVSKIIAETTGAVHLWADAERHKMFAQASHSEAESLKLYDYLNARAEKLLGEGKSVVFDTNFNFYADRQKLRDIASRQGAETVILWVTVPKEVAKARAVGITDSRNGYMNVMTEQQFESIVCKLEPPRKDEKILKIDGTKFDRQDIVALISQ